MIFRRTALPLAFLLLRAFLMVAAFFHSPLFAQQYTISTIAGEGVASTFLTNPTSIAVDPAGNLYVGDWSGVIRKISLAYNITTPVAGTGVLGYSGDGDQATNATIGRSINIALDPSGNLYIADSDNNRIRRVDGSSGIITTAAGTGFAKDSGDGGLAVNAGVSMSTGVTVDSGGDLYFSSNWSRVRKLIAGTGIIETIAGQSINGVSGDGGPALGALFFDPVPGAVDHLGNLYLADYENSRIRMIAANTGIVTTVAGSGTCAPGGGPFSITICQGGFSGDGQPAINATLKYPAAVALDTAGNLYIADTLNHVIRRVDASTGIIETIAGNGVNGFTGDGGPALAAEISFASSIAVDASGHVYFADESNQRIRMLTPGAAEHRVPQRRQ